MSVYVRPPTRSRRQLRDPAICTVSIVRVSIAEAGNLTGPQPRGSSGRACAALDLHALTRPTLATRNSHPVVSSWPLLGRSGAARPGDQCRQFVFGTMPMVVRADASLETGAERLAYPRVSDIGMVLGDANGERCLIRNETLQPRNDGYRNSGGDP